MYGVVTPVSHAFWVSYCCSEWYNCIKNTLIYQYRRTGFYTSVSLPPCSTQTNITYTWLYGTMQTKQAGIHYSWLTALEKQVAQYAEYRSLSGYHWNFLMSYADALGGSRNIWVEAEVMLLSILWPCYGSLSKTTTFSVKSCSQKSDKISSATQGFEGNTTQWVAQGTQIQTTQGHETEWGRETFRPPGLMFNVHWSPVHTGICLSISEQQPLQPGI